MQVYQGNSEITQPQIRLEYKYENSRWQQPTCRVKLTNTSDETLYCTLLDLTDRFAVSAGLLPAGGIWLEPGQEAWALEGKPIYASVPKELWEQGITEYKDILKLIVCTTEFDATLLEQDKLELARTRSSKDIKNTTDVRVKSTLNRLMNRIQTRDLSDRHQQEDLWDDWVTSEVMITTVWPQQTPPVTNTTEEDVSAKPDVEPQATPPEQVNLNPSSVSPRLLNRLVIGVILLLSAAVIVLSLLLWQRSQQDEPKKLENINSLNTRYR
jgi:hypothetical protein